MNPELTDKLKKNCEQLSAILEQMSVQDFNELRKNDTEFDEFVHHISDFIGSDNKYWKVHPIYPFIRCGINGEIRMSGRSFQLREFDGVLKVCYSNFRKTLSAPDLIMACFKPCPTNERSEWRICYKDGDFRNIKPDNLYWERLFVR